MDSIANRGLVSVVERLSALAERLRAVPLGLELQHLADELRSEAELRPGEEFRSPLEPLEPSSTELIQALSRAREEREELRLALAQHSAFCAEKELELRLELEQLQDARAQELCQRCGGRLHGSFEEHVNEALNDFNGKMLSLEQILLQLQCSMSSQMSLLQELHGQMGSNRTSMEGQPLERPGSLVGFRPAPILKKKVRTEEEAEHIDIPLPPQPPQKLAVLPGELKEEDRLSGWEKHAATVEELSGGDSCRPTTASEERRSKSSKEAVLQKTQKLSLDELRTNHDAHVRARHSFAREEINMDSRGGLPQPMAGCWLVLAGILRFWRWSWLWVLWLVVMCVAATGVLIWFSTGGFLEADVTVTTICFLASVAVSVWLLGDVDDFLSDPEHGLDFYAWNAGFIQEWRKKSRRRLMEACSCLLLMWVLRCLVFLRIDPSVHDLLLSISFCVASGGFMAVAYLELHVLSGLELAIDSFSVNFFRVMDVKEALAEWNVLQAMLRHISAKLSRSLLPLGCACGASILYLIELSLLRPDVEGGFEFILQNLWCLPPNCFFLYTLMRAAAVTEKASRVSPLVNSWNFENIDGPDDLPDWMDLERQYLVQYIIQSEAGFYIQGVRLRFFQAVKTSLKLALEEEAKASRRARQDLVQENELLRVQLRSARQRQQAVEAENEALKTLLRCSEVLGAKAWIPGATSSRASEPTEEVPSSESEESPPEAEASNADALPLKASRRARAARARRGKAVQEKPKVELVRKFSFAERDFQSNGPNGTAAAEHGMDQKGCPRVQLHFTGYMKIIGAFYMHVNLGLNSAMLDTSVKFRLARRTSDSCGVLDVVDWKTRMADLQGIMSCAKALYLLLETHHEAIVRVALELALEPEVRRIFAWENWYQESQRREGFRQKACGWWLAGVASRDPSAAQSSEQILRHEQPHSLECAFDDYDEVFKYRKESSTNTTRDSFTSRVELDGLDMDSSWNDTRYGHSELVGLPLRRAPDKQLHQKYVARLDRYLYKVEKDPEIFLERVEARQDGARRPRGATRQRLRCDLGLSPSVGFHLLRCSKDCRGAWLEPATRARARAWLVSAVGVFDSDVAVTRWAAKNEDLVA
eukprot:s1418_g5.t1